MTKAKPSLPPVCETARGRNGERAKRREGETASGRNDNDNGRLSVSLFRPILTSPLAVAPHQILAKVEQVMLSWKEGHFDVQSAQREAGQFWNYMDSVALETGGKEPVEVGYAAVEALHTAVADEEFDPSAIDYSLTDEDVDAYGHDTAFAAAADYAGGATWMPKSDASKRREFWHWWLSEAIPAAWRVVWQPERGALQHLWRHEQARHDNDNDNDNTPLNPLSRGEFSELPS